MNRENKRKLYDKHYYKTHPCDEAFTCKRCGRLGVPEGAGSDHRNHCPYCLCSVHLDNAPGDREADCGALMDPIGVWVRKNGEWALLHRCRMCGTIHATRVAAEDNPLLLMSQASKPHACPPFPLEKLEEKAAQAGLTLRRREGYDAGRWIVLDYADILVHIFHPEERRYYNIERLWDMDGGAVMYSALRDAGEPTQRD